jgi:hypothetical protein
VFSLREPVSTSLENTPDESRILISAVERLYRVDFSNARFDIAAGT